MEKSKRNLWIGIGVLSAIIVLVVIIVLAVVLTQKSAATPDETPAAKLAESLSDTAIFPNGSFTVSVDAIELDSPTMAPREVNLTQLSQWGIEVDESSAVAEAGRLSFFYFWLPPTGNEESQDERRKRDTSVEGSLAIRFGDARTLNVVPLSIASTPQSGLKQVHRLRDFSTVYELQVRMPPTMCKQSDSDATSCQLITWQPYSLSSGNQRGRGSDSKVSLPVACGSQCETDSSSPCAVSSCQTCSGQQEAGADTPVTRRYNMGISQGTVTFQYQTYEQKDRITVVYESKIIFDTGCVGDHDTHELTFAGQSKELRVDVEPNCEGGSGTQWNFQLKCPNPCDSVSTGKMAESRILLRTDNNQPVTDDGLAYITKESKMPSLVAYFCPGHDSPARADDVIWQLLLRGNTTLKANPPCRDRILKGSGQTWELASLWGPDVQGGAAQLTGTLSGKLVGSVSFAIRGTRVPFNDVVSELRRGTNWFFAPYIAQAESGSKQFHENGMPVLNTRNDGGAGIMMITTPLPSCTQIWSWVQNVREGVKRIKDAQRIAENFMAKQRRQAREANQTGVVPRKLESNCVFEDNTGQTIEDAVALKVYNSAASHYCSWNVQQREWQFSRCNNDKERPFNYVNHVCDFVPKPSPGYVGPKDTCSN